MTTLNRRIGWLALGQSAVRGTQLAAAVVLVHLMPNSEWNALALALSVYFVGVTVGSLNLEHSVLAFLPLLATSEYGRFLHQTRRMLVGFGGLIGLIVIGSEALFGFLDRPTSAVLLAVAIVLEVPAVVGAAVFIAQHNHRAAAIWDLASAGAFACASFLPALVAHSSIAVLWGLAAYGVVRFSAFAWIVRRTHTDRLVPPITRLFRRQVAFCAPLGVSLALGTLTRAVDKWIVAWKVPHAIGSYALAAQELPLLAVLPYAGGAAVAAGLVSHLGRGERFEALTLWKSQAQALCTPVVALSVGLAAVAPEVFRLVVPANERGAALSFAVFSFIGVHRVTEYGVVLRAANRNRHIVESAAIVLIGCIVFGIVGAEFGGLGGVSIGTAVAFGIGWMAILRRIAQVFGVGFRDVFPWTAWFRALNVSVTALGGALVAAAPFDSSVLRLLAKTAVFVAVIRLLTFGASNPSPVRVPA